MSGRRRGEAIAFAGIGRSSITRKSDRTAESLAAEAAVAAIRDAGLSNISAIDGLVTMTGSRGASGYPRQYGRDIVDPLVLASSLGLPHVSWTLDIGAGADVLASTIEALHALRAGACTNALIVTTMKRPAASNIPTPYEGATTESWATGFRRPVDIAALYAQRYLFERGLTPEVLMDVVLNNRRGAALTDGALFPQRLAPEDYWASPEVAMPLRLLDCDMPVNGAYAFVLSKDPTGPRPPVFLLAAQTAIGSGHGLEGDWHEMPDTAIVHAARGVFDAAGISPSDVSLAELYDGFSFFVPQWLEALNLVASDRLAEGIRNIRDGDGLPVNTFGGSLSHGRMHGANHLYEAIVQLRGEAGRRQIPNAETAVTTFGGILAAAVAVLARKP